MCSWFLENILFMYVNASIHLQYIFRLRQLMLFLFKTLHFHLHSCKDFIIYHYLFLSEATLQVDTLNVTYPPPRQAIPCVLLTLPNATFDLWDMKSQFSLFRPLCERSPLCLVLKCAEDIGCDAEWQWQLVRVTGSVSTTERAQKKRDLRHSSLYGLGGREGFVVNMFLSVILQVISINVTTVSVSLSHSHTLTHTHTNTHIEAICF